MTTKNTFDHQSSYDSLQRIENSTFTQEWITVELFTAAIDKNPQWMTPLCNQLGFSKYIDDLILSMSELKFAKMASEKPETA